MSIIHRIGFCVSEHKCAKWDGMMMASHLPVAVNEERISAMSAALLSVSERMIETLLGNKSERVIVQSRLCHRQCHGQELTIDCHGMPKCQTGYGLS